MKKTVVGVIGAGRIGKLHAENLQYRIKDAEIKTIADAYLNQDIIDWANGIGVSNVISDASALIRDPEIEAVLICSSTATHTQYIKECARAGKDVFCEKPIADDIESIVDTLKIVEECGIKLQIGFVRRFDHNHQKVHEAVAAGKIGKPYLVKVTSRDPALPTVEYLKSSGGLFYDMMIHDFDMVRYLTGSEVVEVSAFGEVLVDDWVADVGDIDTGVVMLKFSNGMLGLIDNCRRADYGYDQRTEVHGELGCVFANNDMLNEARLCTAGGILTDAHPWYIFERYNDAFILEVEEFLKSHREGTEPLVGGIDGLEPVKIAAAAYKSLRERRTVRMNEI